jgi:hypothetical protein
VNSRRKNHSSLSEYRNYTIKQILTSLLFNFFPKQQTYQHSSETMINLLIMIQTVSLAQRTRLPARTHHTFRSPEATSRTIYWFKTQSWNDCLPTSWFLRHYRRYDGLIPHPRSPTASLNKDLNNYKIKGLRLEIGLQHQQEEKVKVKKDTWLIRWDVLLTTLYMPFLQLCPPASRLMTTSNQPLQPVTSNWSQR